MPNIAYPEPTVGALIFDQRGRILLLKSKKHKNRYVIPQDSIFNKFYHKRKHFIYIDFSCKTDSDDVKINEESEEFLWITPQESLSLPLDPYTERLIQEYLKGNKSKYCKNIIYGYNES
jgi:nucleoside triphosphatase